MLRLTPSTGARRLHFTWPQRTDMTRWFCCCWAMEPTLLQRMLMAETCWNWPSWVERGKEQYLPRRLANTYVPVIQTRGQDRAATQGLAQGHEDHFHRGWQAWNFSAGDTHASLGQDLPRLGRNGVWPMHHGRQDSIWGSGEPEQTDIAIRKPILSKTIRSFRNPPWFGGPVPRSKWTTSLLTTPSILRKRSSQTEKMKVMDLRRSFTVGLTVNDNSILPSLLLCPLPSG